MTLVDRCVQTNGDAANSCSIMTVQCAQTTTNIGYPWLTSVERCAQATTNEVVNDQCCLTDVAYHWPMPLSRSIHVLTNVAYCCPMQMSSNLCTHIHGNACKPWLILPIVGWFCLFDAYGLWTMFPTVNRRRYCLPDAHVPCLMRAGLGLCRL